MAYAAPLGLRTLSSSTRQPPNSLRTRSKPMTGARTVPAGSRVASARQPGEPSSTFPGEHAVGRRSAARRRRRAGTTRSPGRAGSGRSARLSHSCGLITPRHQVDREPALLALDPERHVVLGRSSRTRACLRSLQLVGRRGRGSSRSARGRPAAVDGSGRPPRRRPGTGTGAARAPAGSGPPGGPWVSCDDELAPRRSARPRSAYGGALPVGGVAAGQRGLGQLADLVPVAELLQLRAQPARPGPGPPGRPGPAWGAGCRRAARRTARRGRPARSPARCSGAGHGYERRPASDVVLGRPDHGRGTGRRSGRRRRRAGRRRRPAAPGSARARTAGRRSRPSWRRR